MNAAGRLYNHQGVHTHGWVLSVLLSRTQSMVVVLILAVFTSAIGMVYVTNATRSLNASLQQSLAERAQLQIQWGQLLLEKSAWVTQSRVQQLAEKRLSMVLPERKSVVIVKE